MNCILVYFILLQLLLFFFGIADMLPFSTSLKQQIHRFRWTTTLDLMNTSCARGLDLEELYNFTGMSDEFENYMTGVRFSGFSTPEIRKEQCESNASIFILDGNPGIVWHPETGQCVKTKMQTQAISGVHPNVVYVTSRFLTTGHECGHDDPNVARFKFDKNRPQRLSFLESVDRKTDKQEEWCLRNWIGSDIQVAPDCNGHNPFATLEVPEVHFLEIVL